MDTNDAGEMRIDESIVLRTIADQVNLNYLKTCFCYLFFIIVIQKLGCLEHCRPLLNCLYGRSGALGGPISAGELV